MGLEDLIAHPRIWKAGSAQPLETIPTGFAMLDRALPGAGWPRSAITEICVDRYGIGELGLLLPALASLEQRSIVWVAPPYIPYAPALERFELDVQRMLLVQPGAEIDVPWAIEQIVRSQFRATVLAWLNLASDRVLRRLQLLIEDRQAWAVLFRPVSLLQARSPAALKLRLSKQGEHLRVDIVKCRRGKPQVVRIAVRGEVGWP